MLLRFAILVAVATAVLCATILNLSKPRPALAAGTGGMVVTPNTQVVPQGTNFPVSIDALNVSALGSYEFTLQYDPTLLAYISVVNQPFLGSTGRFVFCPAPLIDNLAGTVRFGCATIGSSPPGVTGDGPLAVVTFLPLLEGTSALTLTQAEMSDELGDAFTSVSAANGSVTIFGGTPPPTFTPTFTPTITPTPTETAIVTPTPTGVIPPGDCGPDFFVAICFDTDVVFANENTPFSIGVNVEDTPELGAFSVRVGFSDLLLSAINFTPSAFLGSTGRAVQCASPTFLATSVELTCVTLGSSPPGASGTGTVAVLTFLPIGSGITSLSIPQAILLDPEANVIAAGYADGALVEIGAELTPTPCPGACPTDTPSPTSTFTFTPTNTRTPTSTPTTTPTPTACPGACPTATTTNTPVPTATTGASTIAVISPSLNVPVGSPFNVAVVIDGVGNLGAFTFKVAFNPSVLQKGPPTQGDFITSSGRPAICTAPILPDPALVQYNCVTTGPVPPPGASGSGVLATLTFTALAAGSSTLTLQDIVLTNPLGGSLPIGALIADAVTVVPASTPTPCPGTCPTNTPSPTMTASPTVVGQANVTINPPQQMTTVGQIVEVTVDIANVSNLGAYQFTMRFDNTKLQFSEVLNDAFLGSTNRPVFCPAEQVDSQNVYFGCATSGGSPPGPTGAGTLARVRFQTTAIGPADLRLTAVDLADPLGTTIPRTIIGAQDEILVFTVLPTVTSTPTITPTPPPTLTPVVTATGTSGCGGDDDCDGVLNAADNCPSDANPAQANSDGNLIDLPGKTFDDTTRARSDNAGDACDLDDDNDGLADAAEISGAQCATIATDPLAGDTDGDLYLDSVECALGTHPLLATIRPPSEAICGPAGDADGDGISNRREVCFYGTDPALVNSDGDSCNDGREAASVNATNAVDVLDLQQIAQEYGGYTFPASPVEADFDLTKNGSIDVIDLQQAAARFGPCP